MVSACCCSCRRWDLAAFLPFQLCNYLSNLTITKLRWVNFDFGIAHGDPYFVTTQNIKVRLLSKAHTHLNLARHINFNNVFETHLQKQKTQHTSQYKYPQDTLYLHQTFVFLQTQTTGKRTRMLNCNSSE